jgi:hypothetical protein
MKYAIAATAALLALASPGFAADAPGKDNSPSATGDRATSAPEQQGQDNAAAKDDTDPGSFSIPAADGDSSAKDKAPAGSKK